MGWSDKEDLARLFIQIATNPYIAHSERYLAVNGMAKTNLIFETIAEVAGVEPPKIALPKKVIEPIGRLGLTLAGKKAPISPEAFSFGLHGHQRLFSSRAARSDYGWETKPLEQTLEEIKTSFKPR